MRFLVKYGLILLLSLNLQAEEPAGIVLYFQDGESTYLLLADEATEPRGWSAFGGGGDAGETVAETAARETEEETRGYFRRDWLLNKLKGRKPVRTNGYNMFFVEVPFVPALRVSQNPLEKSSGTAYHEREHFAWVPVSDLEKALQRVKKGKNKKAKIDPLYLPAASKQKFYWNIWVANMQDAYAEQACPWQNQESKK